MLKKFHAVSGVHDVTDLVMCCAALDVLIIIIYASTQAKREDNQQQLQQNNTRTATTQVIQSGLSVGAVMEWMVGCARDVSTPRARFVSEWSLPLSRRFVNFINLKLRVLLLVHSGVLFSKANASFHVIT